MICTHLFLVSSIVELKEVTFAIFFEILGKNNWLFLLENCLNISRNIATSETWNHGKVTAILGTSWSAYQCG